MRFIFTFIISVICIQLTSAQIETISTKDTTRYTEKEAFDEEKFINASSLRLANKTKEAIPILQGLIKENKTEPAYYYELARNYYLDKNFDFALTNASKAVSLAPDNLFYSIYEAEVFEKQGNSRMAAEKFEIIVSKYPRVEEYWLKLSKLYNDSDEKDKAIEAYDRMVGIFGVKEEILYRKFQTQIEANDIQDAVKTLEQLVSQFPENLMFKNTLASVYKMDGREADSQRLYQEILATDPTNARANVAMAEGLKSEEDDAKYLISILTVIENPSINLDSKIEGFLPYINKYIDNQDSSMVKPLADIAGALVRVHPQEPKAWAVAGDIRLHLGDYTQALTAYDESLKLTQRVYAVYEQKMLLLTYLKKYDALADFANMALDIYPNQLNNFINLAYAELKMGHPEKAISALSTAEPMTTKNHLQAAVINALLGISYTALNDKSNAETFLQKADLLSKGNVNSMGQVAGMLAEFGIRLDLAKIKIEAVNSKENKDPFTAATASLIDFKEKNFISALKWINASISYGGLKYPAIAEQAGDVYFMSKNVSKAIEYWTLAKSMGVISPQLDKKLSSKTYTP